MKSLKITLIVLVISLAVVVAYGYGCGGSDGTSGGDASTGLHREADRRPAPNSTEGSGADSTGSGEEGARPKRVPMAPPARRR